jgi:hypothetical protein
MAKCQLKHSIRRCIFLVWKRGITYQNVVYEHNQIVEDAATGSEKYLLQNAHLKYNEPTINDNHQGDSVGRPSQIYFDGNVNNNYDIKIGGKVTVVARGVDSLVMKLKNKIKKQQVLQGYINLQSSNTTKHNN